MNQKEGRTVYIKGKQKRKYAKVMTNRADAVPWTVTSCIEWASFAQITEKSHIV